MQKNKCVSCGGELGDDIVFIGKQYPSAIFYNEKDTFLKNIHKKSLNITKCENPKCGLVQLSKKYDLKYVFNHYPYESSSTLTMKNILQEVIDDVNRFIKMKKDDVVLDIGGNDGTLLSLIKENVKSRVNIDAAKEVKQIIKEENYKYIQSKFNLLEYKKTGLPNPKVIFSIAMFYHLSNPIDFCKDIFNIMDDDSIFVLQMTYLGTMLQHNILDNIVHEHVAYYSLFSLEYLLSQVGLHIAEARIVKSYGGSLRVFIVKNKEKFKNIFEKKDYNNIIKFEKDYKINEYESLYSFNSRIKLLQKSIKNAFEYLLEKHGDIWGFGASTKGNMLLQWLNIDFNKMPYILDNSFKKIGSKTMGTNIPIISEKDFLGKSPSALFLLPYYYVDAFIPIIKNNIKSGKSIDILIPLPFPQIIQVVGENIC